MTEEKEITLVVPDSWNEVTLGQFQEMALIDPGVTSLNRVVEVFSILTDKDPAEIAALPVTTIKEIASMLSWTAEVPTPEFERAITIDNQVYAVIPRLDELTVGEWVDLENHATELMKNLHKFLAVLYRPVTAQTRTSYRVAPYDAVEMLERAELFKERLMIGQVYGAAVFFSLIGMALLPSLKDSLEETLSPLMTS